MAETVTAAILLVQRRKGSDTSGGRPRCVAPFAPHSRSGSTNGAHRLTRAAAKLLNFLVALLAAISVCADQTWEYSVQVGAQVQLSPPQVTLSWPQDTIAIPDSYTVYRKAPGVGSWGLGTLLPGTATSYTDTGVGVGGIYEYQIVKTNSSRAYGGFGYTYAGLNAPLVEYRGKIVVLVDNSFTSGLAAELARLQADLAGDGWTVIRHDVNRNDSVVNVKNLIQADYNNDPGNVRALLLFGHLPVPYSGDISPDGHLDHNGAWPADGFYGDMDGIWTDAVVADNLAASSRNWNTPADGKYDQSSLPSPVELQIGRVDLSGLTAFAESEAELLRRYLNKDHSYRHKLTVLPLRGLVHDSLGIRNGQAYAATSWRSYAPLVGSANVTVVGVGAWFSTLANQSYLWAYGCGGGSYTSVSGLGTTGLYNDGTTWDFAALDTRAAFYMLCGSWHGDWDSPNNIMRGALATATYGLACFWAGLPHWFLHPMGLGETLGYCTRLTQNNDSSGSYRNQQNRGAGQIHIALMGDPTPRMYPVAPATSLMGTMNLTGVSLSWVASPDPVLGYHVYRAGNSAGPFNRLTPSLITGTTYTDSSVNSGTFTYMVRAVKLETTPSGTFYNPSQGAFVTVSGTTLGLLSVTVVAADSSAAEAGPDLGSFTISRSGNTTAPLTVYFTLTGTAGNGVDYALLDTTATIPTGASSINVVVTPIADAEAETTETVILTLSAAPGNTYAVGSPSSATVYIADSDAPENTVVWVDDALPTGAWTGASGGDAWQWVGSNPPPFSGSLAHQSLLVSGIHYHYFSGATAPLTVNAGDSLITYVFLDPSNPPREVMLQWYDGSSWAHAAYWGANLILWGTDGTASQRPMGALPANGQWARLEVPANLVGLEGRTVTGMNFILYDGRATWDYSGKTSASGPPPSDTTPPTVAITAPANNATVAGSNVTVSANASDNVGVVGVQFKLDGANLGAEDTAAPFAINWDTTSTSNGSHTLTAVARDAAGNQATSSPVTVTVSNNQPVIWVDDALPAGAWGAASGGDQWTWVTSNPTPYSGTRAHQSALVSGMHYHYFSGATSTLQINAGDILVTYVFLDPSSPPQEVLLQWYDGSSWAHAAYWGANLIAWGTNGTDSQRPMGALPPTGQWVRLEVPASLVGLEGRTLSGMNFVLYGGRATWDYTGK